MPEKGGTPNECEKRGNAPCRKRELEPPRLRNNVSAKRQRAVSIVNRDFDFVDSQWLRAAVMQKQVKINPPLGAPVFNVCLFRLDGYGDNLILIGRTHACAGDRQQYEQNARFTNHSRTHLQR